MTPNGLQIVACDYLPTTRRAQFRFPRSKKKRIRKKWAKKAENWRDVDATGDIYFLDNSLFHDGRIWGGPQIKGKTAMIHPEGLERLKKNIGVIRNAGTT